MEIFYNRSYILTIINENQAGFRWKYSTTDHIFSLKALMDMFFNNGNQKFCILPLLTTRKHSTQSGEMDYSINCIEMAFTKQV